MSQEEVYVLEISVTSRSNLCITVTYHTGHMWHPLITRSANSCPELGSTNSLGNDRFSTSKKVTEAFELEHLNSFFFFFVPQLLSSYNRTARWCGPALLFCLIWSHFSANSVLWRVSVCSRCEFQISNVTPPHAR